MLDDLTQHDPSDPALADILTLIQESFAYMDGRIDPPTSMHRLTLDGVKEQCQIGEVWSVGTPPKACMFLTWKEDCLYVGKVAVAEEARGQGLAKYLLMIAEDRAREKGKLWLELQTRVELIENKKTFLALGFVQCNETAHEGYDHPTSVTMRKMVA